MAFLLFSGHLNLAVGAVAHVPMCPLQVGSHPLRLCEQKVAFGPGLLALNIGRVLKPDWHTKRT